MERFRTRRQEDFERLSLIEGFARWVERKSDSRFGDYCVISGFAAGIGGAVVGLSSLIYYFS